MFGKEKTKSPAPAGAMSTISNGTAIQGDVISDGDLRIDGHIMGHIRCNAKVVVGDSAIVDGDIEAQNSDVFGTVNGNVLTTELLCLKSGCVINGNISVGRLDIEANALFNGKCSMSIPQQSQKQQPAYEPPQPKTTTVIEEEGNVTVQQQLL